MRKMLTLIKMPKKMIRQSVAIILLAFPVFSLISGVTFAQEGSQTQVISGKVTEATSGEALPGVSILIKGTTQGTISDMEGNFSIQAASDDILVFSFIGYLNEEVPVGNRTTVDISLVEDVIGLEEVVVTGYGVQKKSDLTGAIASVSGETLTELPTIGVDQALQGRAAGVSVTSNTGMPGGEVQIQIRGISSINGAEPLVIVDGVRASLNGLNPNDIESIEILKDASSAAIYGASGGNGVILVTTKKGKAGKLTTNFNYYRGWQNPWKEIDLLDTEGYIDMMNYDNAFNGRDPFTTRPDTFEYYDWQDIMFRTAIMEEYDLSVSGGNERSTYFVSGNYTKQEGIMRKSDYDRLSFRINSDHQLSKLFTLGENVQFIKTKQVGYDEWMFQNEYNSPLLPVLEMIPYIAPYDENGEWVQTPFGDNPKVTEDVLNVERNNYSVGGNVYLDIKPFKGFVFTSKVNAYNNFNVRDEFTPEYTYTATQGSQWSEVYKDIEQQWGWRTQFYANYNVSLADAFNIGLMAGFEAAQTKWADIYGERRNLIQEIPEYRYFDGSSNDTLSAQIVKGTGWEDTERALFGRINLDYKGKYLATFNIRRDQSSRFGPDYRTGVFPSFSLGWKFSEEQFIQNLGIFSFGKIRFGYGETGANAPERYRFYPQVTSSEDAFRYTFDNSITPSSGATILTVPNFEMRWEAMIMYNAGIDLGFFGNKLNLTIDYFNKQNDGMLIFLTLPATAGFYQSPTDNHIDPLGGDARPLVNIGKVRNQGWEFTIGYRRSEGALKADFDFNMTYIDNEVKDIVGDSIYEGMVGVNLANICLTSEGYPISQFNGYVSDGRFTEEDAAIDDRGNIYIWNQPFTTRIVNNQVDTVYAQAFAQPGDLRFVDQNNDSIIDASDRVNIGSPIPKFIFGFSTNLRYRNFDLSLFFEGKFGHKLFNGSKYFLQGPAYGSNRSEDIKDQYRPIVTDAEGTELGNTSGSLPRMANVNYSVVSDYYVESGNYVRLKNLQLGYTLPSGLTERVGIEKLRIYGGVKNLLTITNYTGFDPEIGSSDVLQQGIDKAGNYPHSRMWLIGVNLQF